MHERVFKDVGEATLAWRVCREDGLLGVEVIASRREKRPPGKGDRGATRECGHDAIASEVKNGAGTRVITEQSSLRSGACISARRADISTIRLRAKIWMGDSLVVLLPCSVRGFARCHDGAAHDSKKASLMQKTGFQPSHTLFAQESPSMLSK